MDLRRKTLLIVATTIAGLMGVLYLASRHVLLRGFLDLEAQGVRLDVERVQSAFQDDLSSLDRIARDYARWDRTYAFMAGGAPDYVASELSDETFVGNRLGFAVLMDPGGRITVATGFDPQARRKVPPPAGLDVHLGTRGPIGKLSADEERAMGLVSLEGGPYLVAARAILTSEGRGPARGVLVFGRSFDAAEIQHLVDVTHVSLSAHLPTDPLLPGDVRDALVELARGGPPVMRPLGAGTVAGYARVPELDGKPGLILRVEVPRHVYRQGQATVSYFLGSLVVIGLVFGTLVVTLLQRIVLAPLVRLSASVARVGQSGDLSSRVEASGEDEIGRLAQAINRMLTGLDQAHAERHASEERFRLLADNVPGVIYMCSNDERYSMQYLNDAVESVTGYPKAEFLENRLSFTDLYHPDDAARIHFEVDRRLKEREPFHLVYRLKTGRGEWRWIEEWGAGVFDASGKLLFLEGFLSDVTERRRSEETLKTRERQHAVVARIGWAALAGIDRDALFAETVNLVAESLRVEHVAVFALLPSGDRLLLRSGAGWREGVVGQASIDATPDSQAGSVLSSHGSVAVEDMRTDPRFVRPPLYRTLNLVSGACVIIEGLERPFGVLAAFTDQPREFAADEVHFLEAVANTLAAAVANEGARDQLQREAKA